jgi:hypothetical protein
MRAWYADCNWELHGCDGVSDDTDRMMREVPRSAGRCRKTGGMRILRYVVGALLLVGLVVTSIGWYLSAHPGGERFESCRWEGDSVVLGYSYGVGDTVSTMVRPEGDHVVAQLRIDRADGSHATQALMGEARYPVSGGPLPVEYPNGAQLNCPRRG